MDFFLQCDTIFHCSCHYKAVQHTNVIFLSICFSPSGKTTGIPIHVFGTETHMTAIVGMALGHRPIPNQPPVAAHTANFLLNSSGSTSVRCRVALLCARELPRHGLCVRHCCLLSSLERIIRRPVAPLYFYSSSRRDSAGDALRAPRGVH